MNYMEVIEELINKEMSFIDLDNFMVSIGYYSVLDDGAISDIKLDSNVIYTSTESDEAEAQINFKIVFDSEDEEDNFIIEVKSVLI